MSVVAGEWAGSYALHLPGKGIRIQTIDGTHFAGPFFPDVWINHSRIAAICDRTMRLAVYLYTQSRLVCLSVPDGRAVWECRKLRDVISVAWMDEGEHVAIVQRSGKMRVYNALSGDLAWSRDHIVNAFVQVDNSSASCLVKKDAIISICDGKERQWRRTDTPGYSCPSGVLTKDQIVLTAGPGVMKCFSLSSGGMLWKKDPGINTTFSYVSLLKDTSLLVVSAEYDRKITGLIDLYLVSEATGATIRSVKMLSMHSCCAVMGQGKYIVFPDGFIDVASWQWNLYT